MPLNDPAERSARGHETQALIAAAAVADPSTLFEESWRDFVFAEVWTRPGLDRRARYLISIAGAAIAGAPHDILADYVRGALTDDQISLPELREAALHLAVYAGWSRGAFLDRTVTQVAGELGLPPVKLAPIRAAPWDAGERVQQGIEEFNKVMTFPGPPPISPYFEAGIDSFVFAEMWCRPGLDQRSRRWITLVGVCESSSETPILSHTHAAMASGNCTPAEMHEFVLQYGIFAGWPKASVVQGAVFAMAKKVEQGLPYAG